MEPGARKGNRLKAELQRAEGRARLRLPGSQVPSSQLVREVTQRNERAGDFFAALASWLADRHRLVEAEQYYGEAVQRMPKLIGPKTQLGVIAMQSGNEDEAKRWFDEAFKADPFNVRVNNSLEVLELLQGFERLENPQVVVRFDKPDRRLAELAARAIERMYPQLCEQFGYRPPRKPLVEIFNQAKDASGHQWFSTRMTGLPYLGRSPPPPVTSSR